MSLVGAFTHGVGSGLAPHAVDTIVGATPASSTLEAREVAAQTNIARYGGAREIPWMWIITSVIVGVVVVQALSSPKRGYACRGDMPRGIG
jgi:hypothetical protein